ncbi:endolytic peptidoglycan transglycosylase RlpA [Erwinia sp. E602]|uniref:endolytic peptidoglycan transglycosylase RlpA n=1 Tax=unclassified Erwinia TaxID=2622719 RepID=UPI000C7626B1|nr:MULTISPECIES: endolytic peptidoglycan transglycosylase RlpA [unclassified Erwinia]PLV51747.1 rare lipoprotein A [Erwinia sp. B116]QUG76696.1 endolytic peptidoglycan transglycosylase RlpA [Erwinia sp. E602]
MRKDWLWIALASAMLAACTNDTQQQAPVTQQQAYNGPVVEIGGAEPHYEPFNPGTLQDYQVNGKKYKVIKDPANFSETGLAAWYGEEANGSRTASGEAFDANAMAAAHPTLPLPSYVRVTNLANGRMIVVRVNDRGPYTPGRIIDLTRAAGDRLNISNNSRVKLDYISVAPDGTLFGPGTIGTTVAKQSYALPARPDISGGLTPLGAGAAASGGYSEAPSLTGQPAATPAYQPAPAASAQPALSNDNVRPVDNSTLNSSESLGAPVNSGGFLGAPQPLRNGVLEGSEPVVAAPAVAATAGASAAASTSAPAATGGNFVVQVGALNDANRARQLASSLGKQFGVPGSVDARGNVYRVQLGRFSTRQQAAALQQRLASEAQQQSFITVAPNAM